MSKWESAPIVGAEKKEKISGSASRWKQAFPVEKKYKFKTPIKEQVFPTSAEKPGLLGVGERMLEAASYPVRLTGTLRTKPETGEKYDVKDPESAFFRPEAKKLQSMIPGEGLPSKIAKGAIGIGADIASDPTLYGSVARKVGETTGKGLYKATRAIASTGTGVPRETLEMASTKGGRKLLEKAFNTQEEIGDAILSHVDKFDTTQKETIQHVLKKLPFEITTKRVVRGLEEGLEARPLPAQEATNNLLKRLVGYIKKNWGDRLSAEDFYDLRVHLDKEIKGKWNVEGGGDFVNAVKRTRKTMKETLERAAEKSGNPQYKDEMAEWAKKMGLMEKFKRFAGKDHLTRDARIESIVANLFGKNKSKRQKLIKELGDMFGEDFIEPAKLAKMASELGDEGKPALLSTYATGKSALLPRTIGGIAGAASLVPSIGLSSPAATTKIILPSLKTAGKVAEKPLRAGELATKTFGGAPGLAAAAHRAKEMSPEEDIEKKEKYKRLLRR